MQSRDEKLRRGARAAAARFGLEYVERYTGYGELATSLTAFAGARGNVPCTACRRPRMAALIVISWRDVPAQVIVKRGREVAKVQLSARFQQAVDRAAMRAGRGSSDAYLEDWRRSAPQPVR